MPSVSIIIATSGRAEALKETLHSLAAISVPPAWIVDLILVENGSRSGAEDIARVFSCRQFKSLKYLFEPARGKSRALNLALAHATGDILLFSDDDIRFPADWLARMCQPIVTDRADAVAGAVSLAADLLRPWMTRRHRAWLASTDDYLSADAPSEMCGANMAIRRSIVEDIGGFDPELGPGITGGGEESLLSWRIKRAGYRIVSAFDAKVEHHPSPDRLQYRTWLNAARLKGRARAYQEHHWFHREIRAPRFFWLYYATKLFLRRAVTRRRKPHDEGIEPWELSYIESMEMHRSLLEQRKRPRNYDAP